MVVVTAYTAKTYAIHPLTLLAEEVGVGRLDLR